MVIMNLYEAGRVASFQGEAVVKHLIRSGVSTIMVLTPKGNGTVSIICVPRDLVESAAMIICQYGVVPRLSEFSGGAAGRFA